MVTMRHLFALCGLVAVACGAATGARAAEFPGLGDKGQLVSIEFEKA